MDDKYKRLQWLLDETARIVGSKESSKEEIEKADGYIVEATGLQQEIEAHEEREQKAADLTTFMDQSRGRRGMPDAGQLRQEKAQDSAPKFKSLGEQLRAVVSAERRGGELDARLKASGLSEAVPSDGGFLVQTDFAADLLRRVYENSALASRVRRWSISGNANSIKIPFIDETSRANGSRWGGVRAYWLEEAGTRTASDFKLGQMEMNLHKLTGLAYATEELLQDTSAMESLIRDAFVEEFDFVIQDAILNGTGAGQPLGIINGSALVSVAIEAGQNVDTIVSQNIIKMWSRMWGRSRGNAIWLINQNIEPQLFTMSMAVGTGGVPVYMPANGLSTSPYGTLFGRPVVPIEQASTIGDVGDIMLVDLSQYGMIDKGGMQASSSVHVRFLYDETAFKFTYRVDGQPLWRSALTPYEGGSSYTLSPFVALAAR